MKNIIELINKQSQTECNRVLGEIEHRIKIGLAIIFMKSHVSYAPNYKDIQKKIDEFIDSVVTEHDKKKYIESQITKRSEKILDQFDSLEQLISRQLENAGQQEPNF